MPTYSKITIEFLEDLAEASKLKILRSIDGDVLPTNTWVWVTSRTNSYEVTTGTPTATAGETTAINFESAFNLDFMAGYVTTLTDNVLEIESETLGENFAGFKIKDENDDPLINGVGYIVTFDNYEEPFDISTVDTALMRSPHYINTPFIFETTTGVNIDLKIWFGDFEDDEPTEAQQTLNITRPSIDFEEFNTDISGIVRNYLESTPNINIEYPFNVVESSNFETVWIRYTASYIDEEEEIADIDGYLGASDGYGYYLEGANPQFDGVLSSCKKRKIARNGAIFLPFLNNNKYSTLTVKAFPSGYTRVYNISYNENDLVNELLLEDTDYFGLEDGGLLLLELDAENINGFFVAYAQCDISQLSDTDNIVTMTFTQPDDETDVYTFNIVDECEFNPKTIIFKNKDGFYDTITMFKKSIDTLKVNRDEFVNNYISNGTYSTTKHQKQTHNVLGSKSIVCNSGHVKECENDLYEQLMLSEYIWFIEDGTLNPIKITTSDFTYKTWVNDQIVEYSIEFDYAYNLINNV